MLTMCNPNIFHKCVFIGFGLWLTIIFPFYPLRRLNYNITMLFLTRGIVLTFKYLQDLTSFMFLEFMNLDEKNKL